MNDHPYIPPLVRLVILPIVGEMETLFIDESYSPLVQFSAPTNLASYDAIRL